MNTHQRLQRILVGVAVAFSAGSRPYAYAQPVPAGNDIDPTWKAFPGFSSDVELSINGKLVRGRVVVATDGQVYVEGLPENHQAWATDHLACLVRAQLDKRRAPGPTWAWVGSAWTCPGPGSAYRIDDPFGCSYRVRDRQIVAVEHRSKGHQWILHLLESCRNPEQQPLPVVVAVHAWNRRTQELESTATHFRTWKRVGPFDLPATIRVLSAGVHAPACPFVELKLTNHRLFAPTVPMVADR